MVQMTVAGLFAVQFVTWRFERRPPLRATNRGGRLLQGKEDCHETHGPDRRTAPWHRAERARRYGHLPQCLKTSRNNDQLHQDGYYCDAQVGPDKNGVPTPAAYKQCMLSRGWRYQSVKREPAPQTWIDPDTGLTCHDILGGFGPNVRISDL